MNIAVFGATGRTGKHIVDQALDAGHTVTVLARYPERMHREDQRLHVVAGDVQERAKVLQVVEGQDAVISVLGQVRERPSVAHLLTVAATNITEAMAFHNVDRLVFLIGAGIVDSSARRSLLSRMLMPIMRRLAGNVLEDTENAVGIIHGSELDWIILQAARLGDDPPSGNLTAGAPQPNLNPVSRADVAAFMLDQVESDRYLRQTPIISY